MGWLSKALWFKYLTGLVAEHLGLLAVLIFFLWFVGYRAITGRWPFSSPENGWAICSKCGLAHDGLICPHQH